MVKSPEIETGGLNGSIKGSCVIKTAKTLMNGISDYGYGMVPNHAVGLVASK